MSESRVKAAKIVAAHGLRGQVKLKPYMALESGVFHGADEAQYKITIKNKAGDVFIAEIEGAADRDAAEKLKGKELYLAASALPELAENEFYTDDLIGLAVKDALGAKIGEISGAHDFGAGDIVEIKFTDGKLQMYSFKNATFPDVDLDAGFVTFVPPEEVEE